jgi:DNA-binding transcriptional MerR regulator
MNVKNEFGHLDMVLSKEYELIYDQLCKPYFVVADTKVSSRMINYYQKNGFLDQLDRKENTKWKFSAFQVIWINVVSNLLNFGFSKFNIQQLKIALSANCLGLVSNFCGDSLLNLYSTLMIKEGIEFRLMITKYPRNFLEIGIDGSISEVWFESYSHKVEILPPSKSEEVSLTIPLFPIVNQLWEKLTGNAVEINFGNYSRLESSEKELIKEIRAQDFNEITLNRKKPEDNLFAAVKKNISPTELKNIPKFLSLKTHCDVLLHYGVEPGKVIHGSVVKKIQNYPLKKPPNK